MQVNVINKGLNYVPTNISDPFELKKDFYRSCRNLQMKIHFMDSKTSERAWRNSILAKLRVKSTFDPEVNCNTLQVFQQTLIQQVMEKWILEILRIRHIFYVVTVFSPAVMPLVLIRMRASTSGHSKYR